MHYGTRQFRCVFKPEHCGALSALVWRLSGRVPEGVVEDGWEDLDTLEWPDSVSNVPSGSGKADSRASDQNDREDEMHANEMGQPSKQLNINATAKE